MNLQDNSKVARDPMNGSERNPEVIKLGAILRIADSCEVMAKDRVVMENELSAIREKYRCQGVTVGTLIRRVYALKGHITRLKKENKRLRSIINTNHL